MMVVVRQGREPDLWCCGAGGAGYVFVALLVVVVVVTTMLLLILVLLVLVLLLILLNGTAAADDNNRHSFAGRAPLKNFCPPSKCLDAVADTTHEGVARSRARASRLAHATPVLLSPSPGSARACTAP